MHLTEEGIKTVDLVELNAHILGVIDSADRIVIEMSDGSVQMITSRNQWSVWKANAGIPPNVRRLSSTITCPNCKASFREVMPVNSCLMVYDCRSCGFAMHHKEGDCCVFCSFGDVPCPARQQTMEKEATGKTKKKPAKVSERRPEHQHRLSPPKRRALRPNRRSRAKPRRIRSQGSRRRFQD